MLRRLARLFLPAAATASPSVGPDRVPVTMHWFDGTSMPIPDWQRIGDSAPTDSGDARLHAYWDSAAHAWLDAGVARLGEGYRVRGSDDFLLLSTLDSRQGDLFLATCQRMLARIRRSLGELADDGGHGRHVVMVFEHPDDYYAYIGHYYPDDGEYAMSSGMFLQFGYGHFVMPLEAIDAMEPVIAHELTHRLVSHLPIPAWLNEGLAVNTEHAMFPHLASPHAQLYSQREITAQHAAYWNADSIQTFWSGKSFLATDDGNRLSYDLATRITALAAREDVPFRAFVRHADLRDGGVGAEHHLGVSIGDLAHAVLGDGPWQPQPETWQDGVERGQFHFVG